MSRTQVFVPEADVLCSFFLSVVCDRGRVLSSGMCYIGRWVVEGCLWAVCVT